LLCGKFDRFAELVSGVRSARHLLGALLVERRSQRDVPFEALRAVRSLAQHA
jgi:hypothetical protein